MKKPAFRRDRRACTHASAPESEPEPKAKAKAKTGPGAVRIATRTPGFLGRLALGAVLGLPVPALAAPPAVAPKAGATLEHRPAGWLSWRGPEQTGVSRETHLPSTPAAFAKPLFTVPLAGRGTPVVADGRLYVEGYRGEDPELQEVLVALDAETGRELWSHGESDFLSDTVYNRYAIGAPTVDPETGDLYAMTANGVFSALAPDGSVRWQRSMMEEFGRLTFPNSRTGSAVVDGDLVIVRGITSNWGAQGAPRDRLYAFDKRTGALAWASTPGDAPKDNSFATPVIHDEGGRHILYTGTGCGNVVALDARTGVPLYRYPVSGGGGVNASVVLDDNRLYAVHGVENLDQSNIGRLVAIDLQRARTAIEGKKPPQPGEPIVLDRGVEAFRNDEVSSFSSSPVLVGNRLYLTTDTGELLGIDTSTGKVLWKKKLARDQVHASPLYADGKLYVPMNDGSFWVLAPSDSGARELAHVQLEGACLGAPVAWNGKVYVHTTSKLYAFGTAGKSAHLPAPLAAPPAPTPGPAVALEARPSEFAIQPGTSLPVSVRAVDANGLAVAGAAPKVAWQKFVPPTAKVRSFVDADFDANGTLVAAPTAKPSAGAFEGKSEALRTVIRGRLVSGLPLREDFESYTLAETHPETHPGEKTVKFAYPPLPWIGGRFAWEVREVPAAAGAAAAVSATGNPAPLAVNRALAKTLDTPIRQRAQTFIGLPSMQAYTIAADVLSDGNRRLMSDVGLINQRYLVTLKGTWQQLEVSSNHERLKVTVPFKWQPNKWYRLVTRVDVDASGKATVRAKAWEKGTPEPATWSIEVPHVHGHTHGSPGLFGFAPDTRFRVFIDNIEVTPNAPAK